MRLYLCESDEGLELSGGDGCAVWTLAVLAELQVELLEMAKEELCNYVLYYHIARQQTILAADFS